MGGEGIADASVAEGKLAARNNCSIDEELLAERTLQLLRGCSRQHPSLGSSCAFRCELIHGDTFSISALHLAIKVPYFSNSGHKNEKVTSYL
eukprot:SAG31_NODE_18021_length_649_cov_1.312727_2_plen_91_part_01